MSYLEDLMTVCIHTWKKLSWYDASNVRHFYCYMATKFVVGAVDSQKTNNT